MIPFDTVAVVGLGLIGGSIARDLAARGVRVLGADADPATLRDALRDGSVDVALDERLTGIEAAQAIVLAVPVSAAAGLLERLAPLERARLVMDVGSTKRSVTACAARLPLADRFVGAHPLAGDHRSGWAASRTDLFRGATVFLSPGSADPEVVRLAGAFWKSLGSDPIIMDAAAHDALLALASHLPQVASSALASVLADAAIPPRELGPGGRDVTRLAGSSPDLWTGIALDNRDPIVGAIDAMEARLAMLRGHLQKGDAQAVRAWFAGGADWFGGRAEGGGMVLRSVAAAETQG